MALAGILTLVRKFVKDTRTFGLLSASRKSVKGVASRSGLASIEQFDILVSAVDAMGDEVSLLRQKQARLRQQMDVIQEATASGHGLLHYRPPHAGVGGVCRWGGKDVRHGG